MVARGARAVRVGATRATRLGAGGGGTTCTSIRPMRSAGVSGAGASAAASVGRGTDGAGPTDATGSPATRGSNKGSTVGRGPGRRSEASLAGGFSIGERDLPKFGSSCAGTMAASRWVGLGGERTHASALASAAASGSSRTDRGADEGIELGSPELGS